MDDKQTASEKPQGRPPTRAERRREKVRAGMESQTKCVLCGGTSHMGFRPKGSKGPYKRSPLRRVHPGVKGSPVAHEICMRRKGLL